MWLWAPHLAWYHCALQGDSLEQWGGEGRGSLPFLLSHNYQLPFKFSQINHANIFLYNRNYDQNNPTGGPGGPCLLHRVVVASCPAWTHFVPGLLGVAFQHLWSHYLKNFDQCLAYMWSHPERNHTHMSWRQYFLRKIRARVLFLAILLDFLWGF